MNRSIQLILITSLLLAAACGSETQTTVLPVTASPRRPAASLRDVAFEGISFRYDPSVFGEVKIEQVPEYRLDPPDSKPDGVAPEHILFTFELGAEHRKARLSLYPIDGFPEVYSSDPDQRKRLEEMIAALRKVLSDKDHRYENEIPHLPFVDAGQDFQAKVRHLSFHNGNGIAFVMHWSHELALVSNANLIYRFEGITADGNYYVTAEMPIKVPFLPDEPADEFEGFNIYRELRDKANPVPFEERLNKFEAGIGQRIETLPEEDIAPRLRYMEEIISSLSVEKKGR